MKKDQRVGEGVVGGGPRDGSRARAAVCRAVAQSLSAAAAHLPPAVCHDEGDGHRGPFAAVGRRLLAVPQDDDLGGGRHGPADSLGPV